MAAVLKQIADKKATSDCELVELVERDLPTSGLKFLRDHGLAVTEISRVVISARALKRRDSRKKRLSDVETDRLVRVSRVVELAGTVFANPQKALTWLRAGSSRMGGRRPLDMLRTDAGGRFVERHLSQIDEGVFT